MESSMKGRELYLEDDEATFFNVWLFDSFKTPEIYIYIYKHLIMFVNLFLDNTKQSILIYSTATGTNDV